MKFKKELAEKAFNYFKEGGSIINFCEILNIHRSTFSVWQRTYPKFKEAIMKGKKEFFNF